MSKDYLNISIPEHFRDYYDCAAVGYITDKQTIFYTNRKNEGLYHEQIIEAIMNTIYGEDSDHSARDESIVIKFAFSNVIVNLPSRNSLSPNQIDGLKYFFSEISKSNEENKHKGIIFMGPSTELGITSLDGVDPNKALEVIPSIPVSAKVLNPNEEIIGTTHEELFNKKQSSLNDHDEER